MTTPKMIQWLLRRVAGPETADDVLGDLEEAQLKRIGRRGRLLATVLTALAAVDMAVALLRGRRRRRDGTGESAPRGILTRGRQGIPLVSWLDFKLGLRMLARYPGLTLVGGLALALGIAFGATVFHLVTELVFPDHPYSDVDRIVGVQNVNTLTTRADRRALHDFATWRTELRTVQQIGARYALETNLDANDGMPTPVVGIAISASAFALAPIPPLLGRPLLPDDEAPGAPAVTVLAYERWQTHCDADPDVVGRVVRLRGAPTTVVGVMPPRFMLHAPHNDLIYPGAQDLWVPFRLDPLDHARGDGPRITVFGRLALGVTPEEAQAELTTLGAIAAAESPETHQYLRPEILTFANPFGIARGFGVSSVLTLSGVFILGVMVILCGNVALLLFARAATREGELVVRSALGASSGRIISQLFADALRWERPPARPNPGSATRSRRAR